MTSTNNNTHHLLTLKQIASWQVDGIVNGDSIITARVPSLQRGAVWEPQQIEMLWDSIMRGFPIGSIVIAKKIEGQNNQHSPTLATELKATKVTSHHILDGQQRCNAIAWGFVNPWEDNLSDDVVLWLDLKPGDRLKNTTRKYLLRVTTKAHPWGFNHSDQTGNLSAGDIEKFKDKLISLHQPENWEIWPEKFHVMLISKEDTQKKIKRPSPKLAMPYDAGFPVPIFLLLKYFKNDKLDWTMLAKDEWIKIVEAWSDYNVQSLNGNDCKYIESGLAIADQACVVAQQVPDLLNGIDDIEQIFQRLNRQGTRLDNEELTYSLIKAYWPEVEDKVRKLPSHLNHTTEARLVGLGIRVALTDLGSEKLVPELTVDRIRNIFRANEEKKVEDIKAHDLIKAFIEKDGLEKTLNWIDKQFLYNELMDRDYGLPAYLRSSLAWRSRDVFAWLMLLAKRYKYELIDDHFVVRKILGLALTIHWFDVDKSKAVDILVKHHNDFANVSISDLNADVSRPTVRVPLCPHEIKDAFQLEENSKENQFVKWTDFWQGVVNFDVNGDKYPEDVATDRVNKYGYFIGKLRNETELLVYAQRAYIEKVFEGFDPSNKLMWKGHNRPWDYYHILPSQNLNAQGKGTKTFLKISQAWQQSIGNQVAVDFSFNRAAQNTLDACKKYENFSKENEFQLFSENLKDFIMELEDADNVEHTKRFVLAAKDRLIKIYQEWYEKLEIRKYL